MQLEDMPQIPFLVVLFFGSNLEEKLTTSDISQKFDIAPHNVHKQLARVVRLGYLVCVSKGPGRGNEAVYSAGKKTFMSRGYPLSSIDACMSHNANLRGFEVRV